MTAPTPYIHFQGTTRDALSSYQRVFGGKLTLLTNGDLGRLGGDSSAIGHGILDGPMARWLCSAPTQIRGVNLLAPLD